MSVHSRGVKPALTADAEALVKAPPVPRHLSTHAAAEWRRVMHQLIARRVLTKGDLDDVEAYCVMAGTVRQIAEEQAAAGGVIDLKMMGISIRCATTARHLAAEYGLTPTSRARIGAAQADDDDDPLAV